MRYLTAMLFLPLILGGGGLIITVPFYVMASDSDTATTEVTATIVSPSCLITLTPPDGVTLDVNSADLKRSSVGGVEQVGISLSSCGMGYASKTPVVVLSGEHPPTTELPSGTGVDYVFKDSGDTANNTASGFWIVVGNKATPGFSTADLYKEGQQVLAGVRGETGNGLSQDIYIGVSCGTSNPCGKQAGSLKATLTFTFKYN